MAAPSNEILAMINGYSWGAPGAGKTFTYSIDAPNNLTDQNFISSIRQALQDISNVANIRFIQSTVSSSTNINITADFNSDFTADGGVVYGITTFGGADAPPASLSTTNITINNVALDINSLTPGTVGYTTLLHEIGHALGLAHPDTGSVDDGGSVFEVALSGDLITLDATVMTSVAPSYGTYTTTGGIPTGLQILDISALQYFFGANTSYHSGNDTYTFDGNAISKTIWDAGGTDTVNQASSTDAVTIDLRENYNDVTQVGESRIWFAFGANIENALGGSGSDTIYGNSVANNIYGYAGNDTVTGGGNADLINGNTGTDVINGNAGNDTLRGGQGIDTINGGKGADILYGDLGDDRISGDLGNDTITGGTGNDTFVFAAGSGADVIEDFVQAGVVDIIEVPDSIFADTSAAIAATTFSGGNAIITFSSGNIITLTGVTSIAADDFSITS